MEENEGAVTGGKIKPKRGGGVDAFAAADMVPPTLDISPSRKISSVSDDSEMKSAKRKSADNSTSKSKSDAASDRESSNSSALSKKQALGPLSKKREFSVPPVLIDPVPGLLLLTKIQAKNLSVATKCASLGTRVGLHLEQLYLSQGQEISQFVGMLIDCRIHGHLVDGESVLRRAIDLLHVLTDSNPLLQLLPQEISSLGKEMCSLIMELVSSYLDAAVKYVPDARVQQPTEEVSDADVIPRPEASTPMLGKSPAQIAGEEEDAEDSSTTLSKAADN